MASEACVVPKALRGILILKLRPQILTLVVACCVVHTNRGRNGSAIACPTRNNDATVAIGMSCLVFIADNMFFIALSVCYRKQNINYSIIKWYCFFLCSRIKPFVKNKKAGRLSASHSGINVMTA